MDVVRQTGPVVAIRLASGGIVERDGSLVPVGGPRQRAVLSLLAERPRRLVPLEALVSGVWGDSAPDAAEKTVRSYVSRLRSALGAGLVRPAPPGYVLDVPDDFVDAVAFDHRVLDARARATTAPREAADLLGNALRELGPVSAPEMADCPDVATMLTGLDERRLSALELKMELEVTIGLGPEVIAELEREVARHPHRERLWASLIRALYQSGRQADALEAYQRVRRSLEEDLGLEPSPDLRELEVAVLTHDPLLRPSAVPGRPRHLAPVDGRRAATPETHYARTDDGVHIAYQVIGDGPVDLLFFGPPISHVELAWDQPTIASFYEGLAGFSRLIVFDKRGVGMSDPVAGAPTLDERANDVRAVMDAVGSHSAVMLGTSDGGELGIVMATRHPERTRALVMYSCFARVSRSADHPIGVPADIHAAFLALVESDWGGEEFIGLVIPSLAADPELTQAFSRFARRAVSPGGAVAQFRRNFVDDVRPMLPHVRVPTLVLHAAGERFIRAAQGRYLAEHIPGACYVELPGGDHLPYGDNADAVVTQVRRFVQEQSSSQGRG